MNDHKWFLLNHDFFLIFSLKRKAKINRLVIFVMYDLPQNIRNDHKSEGMTIRSFLPNRNFFIIIFSLREMQK